MSQLTQNDLIQEAQHASEKQGQPLSRSDFERISGISQRQIYRLFPDGGWSELKERAGIPKHPRHRERLEDDELLSEFHSVASGLGRIPTLNQFNHHSLISDGVVSRRFGGRSGLLARYRAWLVRNEPQSPLLSQLDGSHESGQPPVKQTKTVSPEPYVHLGNSGGPQFGAPIDFRGLRHAPINELGVVFLFGMVSRELGFLVEAVHASFPDCEAKRLVDRKKDRWQRVRIEFEFMSRTFLDHGHDPAKCDLIVCWQHNWPECPLAVVELKEVIEDLLAAGVHDRVHGAEK